jgi:putative ABC transport system permease protein
MVESLRQDVKLAARSMARTPGFTAVAVLMIALGTGANAAMFSVIDAVMLRTPFADLDRIAMVAARTADDRTTAALSMAQYQSLVTSAHAFGALGALASGQRPILTGAGDPRRFNVECVTAGMFRVLGTAPAMGRTFTDDDDRPGAASVVVLSYRSWQRDFAGAPDVIGRTLTLNGVPTTVVGIMPRDFAGPYSRNNNDGWLPAGPAIAGGSSAGCAARGTIWAFVKIKPALTLAAASKLATEAAGIERLEDWRGHTGARVELISLQEQTVGDLRTPLLALLGAVGLVLLIACANVANLQMERIFGRRGELAVRMALGATRWRTTRQTLTETTLLSLMGGAAGLLAAAWTLQLVVSLMPAYIPHLDGIQINGRVLAVTLLLSGMIAMAIGILPAIQGGASLVEDLRASTRTASRRAGWTRRSLVAAQIGLSLTLLVGASLMITSFRTLRPSDPGFNGSDKLIATVRLQGRAAATSGLLFDRLLTRVAAIPGVRAVAGTTYVPMSGSVAMVAVRTGQDTQEIWSGMVTPNYFAEMEIPIVRGRAFDARDSMGGAKVAIVNEAFARRMFPGSDALGRFVTIDVYDKQQGPRQIIGVLRDTRSAGADLRARAEIYIPLAQATTPLLHLLVKAEKPGDPRLASQLRAATAEIDPTQVVDRVMPMQEMLAASVSRWRFGAWLLGLFAAMAVLLSAAGLAASITWWVTQRTREIGVRMALGADANGVVALVMRQGFAVAAAGIALGLGGAAASTRLLASWLYGVAPLDTRTFAISAAAMLIVATAASYLPARRAARGDPIVALRAE